MVLRRWWHLLTHPAVHVVLTITEVPHPSVTDWIKRHLLRTGRATLTFVTLLARMLKPIDDQAGSRTAPRQH